MCFKSRDSYARRPEDSKLVKLGWSSRISILCKCLNVSQMARLMNYHSGVPFPALTYSKLSLCCLYLERVKPVGIYSCFTMLLFIF